MTRRMRVKICGITRVDDALCAADLGADALGLIFARRSPRRVSLASAAAIVRALPPFVTPVGVFVDPSREEVLTVLDETGIRVVQLHGNETPEEAAGYPVPVVKAFRVGPGFDPERLRAYKVAAYLLDNGNHETPGGTGEPFDWALAAGASHCGPVVLAGGLNPENIEEAIRVVRPYAVDINSGVEETPGVKDHALLRRLFARLRTIPEEGEC